MKQTTKSTLIGIVISTIIGAAAGLSMLQRDQSQAIQEVSGEIRALREETTQIKQQVIEVEKAQKKNELTKEERAGIHGHDEHIPLEKIIKTVQFYVRLMRTL